MIDFLNSFKSLVKVEKTHCDNNIFKLHYKFTVILLIVFSILLTSKQYFGDPIDCYIDEKSGIRKEMFNTYCWIYGTFIVKSGLKEPLLTGLGNNYYENETPYYENFRTPDAPHRDTEKEKVISQKYYQWVCIVFCFQALLFYVPRYLWKTWEAGRLRLLVKDFGGPLVSPQWDSDSKEELIKYMLSGLYSHNCYAVRFAFCEVLNLLNVLLQIILMDWFLTGNFRGYGVAVAAYNNINPMTEVFPKMTKCTFYNYGPSGSGQKHDGLCILPLNIVNEKLFLFLWFWFSILTILSFYQIIYRMFVCISPRFRSKLLRARCRFLSEKHTLAIMRRLTFGDMFFLDLLGKNMNPIVYREMVISMADVLIKDSVAYSPEITIVL